MMGVFRRTGTGSGRRPIRAVLAVLMLAGLLLGACSRVGPDSTGAPDSETLAVSAGTRGPTSVTVTWTAPAAEPTITGYELQWRPSSDANWTDSTVTIQVLPGAGYRLGVPSSYVVRITDDD